MTIKAPRNSRNNARIKAGKTGLELIGNMCYNYKEDLTNSPNKA